MEQYMWILWVFGVVFFGIVEAATVNMVSLWFVGGALAALVAQLLGGPIWLQTVLFFVVSGALLFALRPFVRRFVTPNKIPTNADMVIGQESYITETEDNLRGTGALKLDGKEWSVRSESETVLAEGTLVKVVKIEGVKLFVEPVPVKAGV